MGSSGTDKPLGKHYPRRNAFAHTMSSTVIRLLTARNTFPDKESPSSTSQDPVFWKRWRVQFDRYFNTSPSPSALATFAHHFPVPIHVQCSMGETRGGGEERKGD